MKRTILITGGAGFIGSHVVRLFVTKYPDYRIVNLDLLTYAGNLANLRDIENAPNYTFVRGDICDYDAMRALFAESAVDGVIHLAAESHVDRSIRDPFTFARTNVMGTLTLLQAAKEVWGGAWEGKRFYHISTDEVYGALPLGGGLFTETTRYDPHSPYSASKASSDHFVRAFHDTYGLPAVVTNCSNNYGPYQFPEKLIPLFINNIRHNKPLPVYGRGENVRDWLYVEDHARAIDTIFHRGRDGETYNIGGFNEWRNIDLIRVVIRVTDRLLGRPEGTSEKLITYVTDRAGHDLRYAIDSRKLKEELGWEPSLQFEEGIEKTVRWYLDNQPWMDNITSGELEAGFRGDGGFGTLSILFCAVPVIAKHRRCRGNPIGNRDAADPAWIAASDMRPPRNDTTYRTRPGPVLTFTSPADFGERRPHIGRQVGGCEFELQAADPGADINKGVFGSRCVDIGRKGFLHADRRTASADVARHDADETARAVASQHEGFEDAGDLLAQLFGDVRGSEVLLVHLIRYQFIGDLRTVEQPRGICLFNLPVCHIVPFIG